MKSWLIWKVKNANGVKIAPAGRVKPAPLLKFANLTKITNFLYFTNFSLFSVRYLLNAIIQFAGHLAESQRAMVAANIANLEVGQKSANLHSSTREEAAEKLNVSKRTVNTAKKVQRR